MNRLRFNRGYLCGAMDRAKDGGIGWRRTIQEVLADLEITWLDPTNKPIELGIEDLENRKYRHKCKKDQNWDAVRNDMHIIQSIDIRLETISDFMIMNVDTDIHACGTYYEFTVANQQDKPIIARIEQGKQYCPDWLFGCIPHEMIFSTWEEVHAYLYHIAYDPVIEDFGRWYFFNFNSTGE